MISINQGLELKNMNSVLNAFTCFVDDAGRPSTGSGSLSKTLVAIKDNINLRGYPTSCGSNMLKHFVPSWNAAVIDSLLREDAKIIGKTNLDEFGMGSYSTRSIFGPVRNFHDVERTAGGSSGGSAVAVASGMCHIAIGSDTGGSIRLPASYCKVIGFKPTYGRISRHGLVSYASSLDTIGIITDNVELTQKTFDILKETGGDRDMRSYRRSHSIINKRLQDIKIGIVKELVPTELMASTVTQTLSAFVDHIKSCRIQVSTLDMPYLRYALAAYYVLAMIEASSCLARFPSQHFNTGASFGMQVQDRIRLGKWMASHKNASSFFGKALDLRTKIRSEFSRTFEEFDIVICPTSIDTAPLLTELHESPSVWTEERWEHILASDFTNDHLIELLSDLLTAPASLAGIPAISIPFGEHLCGIQLMTAANHDEELLNLVGQILPTKQELF